MINFLGFPARDMFWTDEWIKCDKLIEIFPVKEMFLPGEWIKYDKLLEIFPARGMFWMGEWINSNYVNSDS